MKRLQADFEGWYKSYIIWYTIMKPVFKLLVSVRQLASSDPINLVLLKTVYVLRYVFLGCFIIDVILLLQRFFLHMRNCKFKSSRLITISSSTQLIEDFILLF